MLSTATVDKLRAQENNQVSVLNVDYGDIIKWSQDEDDIVALIHHRMAFELAKVQKEFLPERSVNEIKKRMATLGKSKFIQRCNSDHHDDEKYANNESKSRSTTSKCRPVDPPIIDRDCEHDNSYDTLCTRSNSTTFYPSIKRIRLHSTDAFENSVPSSAAYRDSENQTVEMLKTDDFNCDKRKQLNLSDLKSFQRPPMLNLTTCGRAR